MSDNNADVIIVGGGIHGCATALALARRGITAIVLEMEHIGRFASGTNAGGVRSLGRHFAEVPLSRASTEIWKNIESHVGDDCGFDQRGQVKIAETPDELDTLRRRMEELHRLGYHHEELIGSEELFELIPALSRHCMGGMVVRDDGLADPYRATAAFARQAETLGQRVIAGMRVVSITPDSSSAWSVTAVDPAGRETRYNCGSVINAAGAWAGTFAAMAGEPVPLKVVAPLLMVTERLARFIDPVVGASGRKLSFKQFGNGTLVIGGGYRGAVDMNTARSTVSWSQLAIAAETVTILFPQLASVRLVRAWAGIEASMPDDLPVISPSCHHAGLFHQFGFSAHGFQLAPIVGEIMADLVMGQDTDFDLSPFRIERFQER